MRYFSYLAEDVECYLIWSVCTIPPLIDTRGFTVISDARCSGKTTQLMHTLNCIRANDCHTMRTQSRICRNHALQINVQIPKTSFCSCTLQSTNSIYVYWRILTPAAQSLTNNLRSLVQCLIIIGIIHRTVGIMKSLIIIATQNLKFIPSRRVTMHIRTPATCAFRQYDVEKSPLRCAKIVFTNTFP